MSTLIFDIETVGAIWSELDEFTQETLLRWVERTARNAEEKETMTRDVQSGLGFSPLTGEIVALGLYDLERTRGVVYYVGDGKDTEEGPWVYKPRSEEGLLQDFWAGAISYNTFVTFNGRSFDAPFLYHRSVVHNLRPTVNLLEGRYPHQQKTCRHIDLQDELTFYGAMSRRPSLHLFCRAYGIPSPKGEISGDKVTTLYRAGKTLEIARYNATDVVATRELYAKWQTYLAFGNQLSEDIQY